MRPLNVMLIDDNPGDNFYNQIIIEEAGVAEQIMTYTSAEEALVFLQTKPPNQRLM
jgi:hypothetical protein